MITREVMKRHHRATTVALFIGLALAVTGPAAGASWENECPPADDACAAIVERLEGLLSEVGAGLEVAVTNWPGSHDVTVLNWPPPQETTEVAGVVALHEDDRAALDLVWIGIFLMAGLTLGLYFARLVWAELRQWFHA